MPSGDSAPFDAIALLDALERVDFIVVGGTAAALHGGPRVTLLRSLVVPRYALRATRDEWRDGQMSKRPTVHPE